MSQSSIPESDHRGQQSAPVVSEHSSLPWELVEATEHHGAYICEAGGADVCDLYTMSNPMAASVRNGGTSFPVPFRNADANAAFIVRAVNSHEALVKALEAADRICKSALPKFNWGASFLDAEAIAALNEGMLTIERAVAALASAREVQP